MTRRFVPMQLGSIEIFIKAAETLSFVKTAVALGLSAAAVSRSVARLEQRLGASLFTRSTRRMILTDDGLLYADHCRTAVRQIAEAEDMLSGRQNSPSGQLRISVPTTYAHYRLAPLLPDFMAKYPDIQIELNISNRNIDFTEDGFDLAIRLGELTDSQLVSRKLEDAALGIFAAPAYLASHPAPTAPEDLSLHSLIPFEVPSTGRPFAWLFCGTAGDFEIIPKSRIIISQDFLGCVSHAVAGGGLVQAYDFIAARYVKSGDLVEVLKPYRGRTRRFSVIYPPNRQIAPRVRAFIDYLASALGRIPPNQ